MAEQFVGQELAISQRQELFYWSRDVHNSNAEVDFCAVVKNQIHPIEVKSGVSGRLRSLHLALKTYPQCGDGLVFSVRNFSVLQEERIQFIPLYFAYSATGGNGDI